MSENGWCIEDVRRGIAMEFARQCAGMGYRAIVLKKRRYDLEVTKEFPPARSAVRAGRASA